MVASVAARTLHQRRSGGFSFLKRGIPRVTWPVAAASGVGPPGNRSCTRIGDFEDGFAASVRDTLGSAARVIRRIRYAFGVAR